MPASLERPSSLMAITAPARASYEGCPVESEWPLNGPRPSGRPVPPAPARAGGAAARYDVGVWRTGRGPLGDRRLPRVLRRWLVLQQAPWLEAELFPMRTSGVGRRAASCESIGTGDSKDTMPEGTRAWQSPMTRANHVDRILVNAADFAVSTDVLVQAQFTCWRASIRRNSASAAGGSGTGTVRPRRPQHRMKLLVSGRQSATPATRCTRHECHRSSAIDGHSEDGVHTRTVASCGVER